MATIDFLNPAGVRWFPFAQEIDQWLRNTPIDQSRADLLSSFSGFGQNTAKTLIIVLPELGRLSSKQIGALTGLAP